MQADEVTAIPSTRKLILAGVLLEACFLFLFFVRNWNDHIPAFLSAYLVAFLTYLIVCRWTLRADFVNTPRVSLYIVGFAILFRLTVFAETPSISEDIYRYIWDGNTQVAGIGPYDYPPGAPQLAAQRNEIWPHINHKDYKTPYAAGAETVFRWISRISKSLFAYKTVFLALDILLIEAIRRLLAKEEISVSMLLLYAWHPLPVVEFSGSGHMDIIGISLLFVSYLLLRSSQEIASGGIFALAALTKYLPLAALPWLLKTGRWKFVLFAGLAGAALVFQYYTPDLRMLSGVYAFYEKWWFNDSLFGVLYRYFGGAEPARIWGMFFVALTAIFAFFMNYSFYHSLLLIYGAVFLFSPVVHPWYLCWIVPFLPFRPSRPWLLFTGWVALSYIIRYLFPGPVWGQVLWLKLLVYLPLYALLIVSIMTPKSNPMPVKAAAARQSSGIESGSTMTAVP
jgi:alpha-1,6-mannosyltransferase